MNHPELMSSNLSTTLNIIDAINLTAYSCVEGIDIAKDGDSSLSITIQRSFKEPILIDRGSISSLVINFAQYAHAHVVLMNEDASGSVSVTLNRDAHCSLYLVNTKPNILSSQVVARIKGNAQLALFELAFFFGPHAREQVVHLEENHASVAYFGLDELCGSSVKKSMLTINHVSALSTSTQSFRGIYSGSAQGTFFGQVVIDKLAEKSSARQLYKSVLIGKLAKAHVMPQLVIHNQDINASHGASIGCLDSDAKFYLQSRGFNEADATYLLLKSFLDDVLQNINVPSIKNFLSAQAESCARLLGETS